MRTVYLDIDLSRKRKELEHLCQNMGNCQDTIKDLIEKFFTPWDERGVAKKIPRENFDVLSPSH